MYPLSHFKYKSLVLLFDTVLNRSVCSIKEGHVSKFDNKVRGNIHRFKAVNLYTRLNTGGGSDRVFIRFTRYE